MAHADRRIAAIEQELAELKADRDAENAAAAAARPAGIPATWIPITFKRGEADWVLVGWLDPDFQVSVYRATPRSTPAVPASPAGPPGPP